MKKLIVFCALIVSLCTNYARAEGTWTTFDIPGASSTRLWGIDGGNIVGTYGDGYNAHGFLFNGTSWTTLDMPGAPGTYATGIDGSNIVGWYYAPTFEGGTRGFLFNGEIWTTLDPGGLYTFLWDIDGSNIVGTDGISTSFFYNGTNWTTLNIPLPGATHRFAYGIDGSNIVGTYMYASTQYSFLYNGETCTTLPGYSVMAMGIDGSNIVGYSGWGYDISGYLYDGTSVTILNMPGAARTWLLGIDGNTIVGFYEDASGTSHGLIYTIAEPVIEAFVAFSPDTLNKNIKVQAQYATACITLPEGYDVSSIDASTIAITSLTGTDYQTDYYQAADLSFTPQVGDHNEDGTPDLTVKFNRRELIANLWVDDVAITVEGELLSGEHFKGIGHIRVIDKGK